MARRSAHRTASAPSAFYPQFSGRPEAPYIQSTSLPSTPYGAKAFSEHIHSNSVHDVERVAARTKHCAMATQKREKFDKIWKERKEQLDMRLSQEKLGTAKRLLDDKVKREQRWTQKTEGHPFSLDQWALDEESYKTNQESNAKIRERESAKERALKEDRAKRCNDKIADVDVLDELRKEKKRLLDDQKELRARLDLDKVDKRCAAVTLKVHMRHEAHQDMLVSRGQLDRSHSDFFSEERLNNQQRQRRAEQLLKASSAASLRSPTSSVQSWQAAASDRQFDQEALNVKLTGEIPGEDWKARWRRLKQAEEAAAEADESAPTDGGNALGSPT